MLYKPSFCASPLAQQYQLRTRANRDIETRSMPKSVTTPKPHKAKHLIMPLLSTAAVRCGAETNRPFSRALKSQVRPKAACAVLRHANTEPAVKFANPSALLLNSIAADIFAGRAAQNFSVNFNARCDSKALKTHNARNFSAIFDAEARF